MPITIKKIRPYFKVLLILGLAATGIYILFFLKYYFYPALTGSQAISTLQQNVAVHVVNVGEFNGLVKNISQKASTSPETTRLNNPFK